MVVAACGTSHVAPAPTPAPPVAAATCAPTVPAAACAAFRAAGGTGELARCTLDAPDRVGVWRYALIAPLYAPDDTVAAPPADAAMTVETRAVLGAARGPVFDGKTVAAWAIVPADALVPQWKVVAIAGHHPLDDAGGPLAVGLCAPGARVHLDNIDPGALTTVAMTGTTAMARLTAVLMDRKGATYPARDIAPWFQRIDFVHVSNEVSFVPSCEPRGVYTDPFCSREGYIALLEAIHANVVELDGSHLSDHGWRWLTHTIEMYEQRGWHFFGGGRDQLEATRPLLLEHHGNKLALLGCNMPHSTAHVIRNGPNVGYCDVARLDWQVRDLRRQGYLPIVSIQHEEVYSHDPPDLLVRDFRRLAAAGAAVVFGSQAHVAHPWEVHDGAYVHYGAGNLFFDQGWAGVRDGVADRLYFHRGRLISVGHLYTRLEEHGRPRPMTDPERRELLATLDEARAKLPPASPWATPREAPAPAERPDSFLAGTEAVLIAITLGDDGAVVRLRKPSKLHGLQGAIEEFVAAKYGVAHVTLAASRDRPRGNAAPDR